MVGQIALSYQKWLYILDHYLDLKEDVQFIISLGECLFERQLCLYEESKEWFRNIYKDRCAETFVRAPKRHSRSNYNSRTQESPQERRWQSTAVTTLYNKAQAVELRAEREDWGSSFSIVESESSR